MKEAEPSYQTRELREFGEVLRGRRTINLYLQTPVPKKLVRAAIEAATWAPNHHVTEPWRFYLLGKKTIGACVELVRDIDSLSVPGSIQEVLMARLDRLDEEPKRALQIGAVIERPKQIRCGEGRIYQQRQPC